MGDRNSRRISGSASVKRSKNALDFDKRVWKAALAYADSPLFISVTGVSESVPITPLSAVNPTLRWAKLDKVVVMIECITGNGFGDFQATLKDPSSKISARIHRSAAEKAGDPTFFHVGAVLVLASVSVCCFGEMKTSNCYLNIVGNNLIKVFAFEGEGSSCVNLDVD